MRFFALFVAALLIISSASFASFTFLYSVNGSNTGDGNTAFEFMQPTGLAYANGKLYVGDSGKPALYIMNESKREKILWSSSENSFSNPLRTEYENGVLYVADGGSGKIRTYAGVGSEVDTWSLGSLLQKPSGLAMDEKNFYITDLVKKNLLIYSRSTKSYDSVAIESGGSDGQLSAPADVELYGGKFFISDQEKKLIFVYESNFTFLYTIGRGRGGITLTSPRGIEIYQDRLYVADTTSNRVVEYTLDGYPIDVLDSKVANGNFSYPEDIAIADGRLYVADSGNKLVKVFQMNQTVGNNTVRQLIADATNSLTKLVSLQETAKRLNVSYGATDSLALDLANAESDYSNFAFTGASSLAQKVIDTSGASYTALSQSVEVKMRQIAKDAQDKVAPYRKLELGALAAQLSQLDNKFSDLNGKLLNKSFSAAADVALELPALAEDFSLEAQGKSVAAEKARKEKAAAQMGMVLDSTATRLQQLKDKSVAYRQQFNLSNSDRLLNAAKVYSDGKDFDSANSSLELALVEIISYENTLSEVVKSADAALANISVMEFEMNTSASKPTLIPADLSAERLSMSQARETAYTSPQLAIAMAKQAAESASGKVKNAQSLSLAVAGLLIMFGLAAMIGIVFFIHLRNRKRKGLEDAGKK